MPKYQNKPVEGACERLGKPCQRKEFFIAKAEEFGAQTKQYNSTFNYGKKNQTTWYFWGLNVPDSQQDRVFAELAASTPELVNEDGSIYPYWLKEFPCFLGCEITICSYCGKQHEKRLIRTGYCLYDEVRGKKSLVPYQDLEDKELVEQIEQDIVEIEDTIQDKDSRTEELVTTIDQNMTALEAEGREAAVKETLSMLSTNTLKQLKDHIISQGADATEIIDEIKKRLSASDEEE
jgi:hypothetical protein